MMYVVAYCNLQCGEFAVSKLCRMKVGAKTKKTCKFVGNYVRWYGLKLYLCANSLHFIMDTIKLKDLTFKPYISRDEIAQAVKNVAARINEDLADKSPLFLCVLNGAFVFAADLFREINIPDAEISFIRMKSYIGTHSTGEVHMISGLHEDISGRTVVIIEDIVDSGFTLVQLKEKLQECNPADIKVATLLFKPESLKYDVNIDYVALDIPPAFIVGYGLDYDEMGRNLKDIYTIVQD